MNRIWAFASGGSACAVAFVVVVAGCDRTGLRTGVADGGWSSGPETQEAVVRDQAMEPQVDLWDGGKDLETPPEVSFDGPVLGPEIGWDAETPSEAGSSACSGAINVTTTLADLGWCLLLGQARGPGGRARGSREVATVASLVARPGRLCS